MKLINVYDDTYVASASSGKDISTPSKNAIASSKKVNLDKLQKAKPTKYISRKKVKGKWVYTYAEKSDGKKGFLSSLLNFFGAKTEKEAKQKTKELYNNNKPSLSGIDLNTFSNYLGEYLANKDKWDKRLSGQQKEKTSYVKDKKTGQIKKKKTTESAKGKKDGFKLSIMKQVASVIGEKTEEQNKAQQDESKKKEINIPKELSELEKIIIRNPDFETSFNKVLQKKQISKETRDVFKEKYMSNGKTQSKAFRKFFDDVVNKNKETIEKNKEEKQNKDEKRKRLDNFFDKIEKKNTPEVLRVFSELKRDFPGINASDLNSILNDSQKISRGDKLKKEHVIEAVVNYVNKKEKSSLEEPTNPKQIKAGKLLAKNIAEKTFIDGKTLQPGENKDLLNSIEKLNKEQGKEFRGIMLQEYARILIKLNSKLFQEGESFREELKSQKEESSSMPEKKTKRKEYEKAKEKIQAANELLGFELNKDGSVVDEKGKVIYSNYKEAVDDLYSYDPIKDFDEKYPHFTKEAKIIKESMRLIKKIPKLKKEVQKEEGQTEMFKAKKMPVGTVSGKYKKVGEGKWIKVKEKVTDNKVENNKLKRWKIDEKAIDSEGNYVLYHGTNKENADKILSEGLKPIEKSTAKTFTTTTKKDVAKEFAVGYDSDIVLEIKIPKNKIVEYLWPGGKTSVYQKEGEEDTQHALRKKIDPKFIKLSKGFQIENFSNKKLQKAKYIKRIPKPGGGWRYIYKHSSKKNADEKEKNDKKDTKDPDKKDKDKKETNPIKERMRSILKKMANVLAEALSGQDTVQSGAQGVEEFGEDIKRKGVSKKQKMEKAKRMPVGTVSKGYKKVAEGKWIKVKEDNKLKTEKKKKSKQRIENKKLDDILLLENKDFAIRGIHFSSGDINDFEITNRGAVYFFEHPNQGEYYKDFPEKSGYKDDLKNPQDDTGAINHPGWYYGDYANMVDIKTNSSKILDLRDWNKGGDNQEKRNKWLIENVKEFNNFDLEDDESDINETIDNFYDNKQEERINQKAKTLGFDIVLYDDNSEGDPYTSIAIVNPEIIKKN